MALADELAKLQQLHGSGALTDEEFAQAKEAVLRGTPPARTGDGGGAGLVGSLLGGKQETLGDAANRFVSFQMVMSVIGLIIFLSFFLLFFLPKWNDFPKP